MFLFFVQPLLLPSICHSTTQETHRKQYEPHDNRFYDHDPVSENVKKSVDRGVGTRMTSSDRVRPAAGWDWLSNENEGLESSVCGVVWLTMKSSHRKRTNCRHNNYSRDQALCGLVVCSRITNRSWPLSLLLTLLTPAAFLLFPGTRVRGSTTNVEIYRPIRSLSRCWLFWDFDCSMLDGWVLIVVGFSGGEWLVSAFEIFLNEFDRVSKYLRR